MTKRINKPEQLPSWFSLERYEVLLELTVREFLEQLKCRTFTISVLDEHGVDEEGCNYDCHDYVEQILSGEVILKGDLYFSSPDYCEDKRANQERIDRYGPSSVRDMYDENMPSLNSDEGVYPISYIDLSMMDYKARKDGVYKEGGEDDKLLQLPSVGVPGDDKETPLLIRPEFMLSSISIPLNDNHNARNVALTIELLDSTDDEIIASLRGLLPKWRAQLNIPEPIFERPRVGESTIPKIVCDCLIPAMDLMIWEYMEGVKITQALLERTLFPHTLRSSVIQTLKRGVLSVQSDEHERALRLYLDNNPELYDRKMSDYIEMYRK